MAVNAGTLAMVAVVVLTSGLFLAATADVSAHKPVLEAGDTSGYGDATGLSDPEISWAIYGYLESGEDTDYYYFDLKAPLNVFTEILVPEKKVYGDFYPAYAIVGPGLANPVNLPFPVPARMGAVVTDQSPGTRDTFYEPFTGISYYRGGGKHTMLTVPGRYYVVVYDPDHVGGDYVLAVGEKESFGARDLPGVIAAVLKIRAGRADHSETIQS